MKFAIYHHRLVSTNDAKPGLKYQCPFCGKRLIYHKFTKHHRATFSHFLSKDAYYNPGETSEHIRGKHQLAEFFISSTNSVIIEKYLPEINQWPDLMVNNVVIEYQCSPISSHKLTERIKGYSKLNLKSWWILGRPYQKRNLQSAYVAKFLNYYRNLGFFLLFWKTDRKCLEIHYAVCECGDRLSYQIKRITTLNALYQFINRNQLSKRNFNNFRLNKIINSDVNVNRKRLFHGDHQLIELQERVSYRHNSIMGCPIICHLPLFNLPIFNKRALLWRVIIILLIDQYSSVNDIYRAANKALKLPLTFCQLSNDDYLYQKAFRNYISLLVCNHYIQIKDKKITKLEKFRWFNNYYDKKIFLKTHSH